MQKISFLKAEYSNKRRKTWREKLFDKMENLIP